MSNLPHEFPQGEIIEKAKKEMTERPVFRHLFDAIMVSGKKDAYDGGDFNCYIETWLRDKVDWAYFMYVEDQPQHPEVVGKEGYKDEVLEDALKYIIREMILEVSHIYKLGL